MDLNEANRKLNVLDPAVKGGGSNNRWGGSGEIGGSPRKTGTTLSPVDIAEAVKLAYRRPGMRDRVRSIALAVVLSGLPMVAGWLIVVWNRVIEEPRGLFADRQLEFLAMSSAVAIGCLLVLGRRRRRRVFGLQKPEGRGWPLMAPAVTLGGLAGGIWIFLQSWLQAGAPGSFGIPQLLSLVRISATRRNRISRRGPRSHGSRLQHSTLPGALVSVVARCHLDRAVRRLDSDPAALGDHRPLVA